MKVDRTCILLWVEVDLCSAPEWNATVSVATNSLAAVFTILCASRGDTETGAVRRRVDRPLGNADCGLGRLTLKIIMNTDYNMSKNYNIKYAKLIVNWLPFMVSILFRT